MKAQSNVFPLTSLGSSATEHLGGTNPVALEVVSVPAGTGAITSTGTVDVVSIFGKGQNCTIYGAILLTSAGANSTHYMTLGVSVAQSATTGKVTLTLNTSAAYAVDFSGVKILIIGQLIAG